MAEAADRAGGAPVAAAGTSRFGATLVRRLGIAALLLGSLGIGLFGYSRLQEQAAAGRYVEHTAIVITNLERLSAALVAAESSQRAHLLSGLDYFLDDSAGAADRVWRSYARLQELVADNPQQAGRLGRLEGRLRERLDRLAVLARTRNADADLLPGAAAMTAAQALITEMINEEQRLYVGRNAAYRARTEFSSVFLLAASVFFVAVFLLLFWLMEREIGRRATAEAGLSLANDELERRVEERTEAAERSRRFMTTVVDNMQDAILVNRDDRVAFANNAFARMVGAESAAELMGRAVSDFVPEERREMAAQRIRDMKATGLPAPFVETRLMRPDGSSVDVEVSSAPFQLDQDVAIMAIFHDATDRKSAEQQLRQAQKMEAVGQLTGGIAHDFNNLLGVVIGNLDLVLESDGFDDETPELVRAAQDAAVRGAELTQRLLAFSRKQALTPRILDFNERLPGLSGLLRRTLGENIRLVTEPAPDLHRAVADPSQLENAVVNLAINARDAMPGGGTLTIETRNVHLDDVYAAQHTEVEPGDYVMLAVTDTGTGMDAETVERAFEPFFTTKPVGQGSGLGLSMVYGFVKQSGGHVKVYSEPGHGTTVKLYLPRALQDSEAAPAARPSGPIPHGRETVLVVEDNEQMRLTAVRLLSELSYTVVEAESGPAGLALVTGGLRPDLLFTDIVMPGMSGYELVEAVRARVPDIKVLFTSGYAEASLRAGNGHAGPVLGKPYRKRDLGIRVRQVLDGETLADSPLMQA